MDTMHIVLSVIEVLACLFLIVTILLQEGASQGLSGTMQSILSKITTGVAILFVVLAVVLNLI